MFIFFTPIVDMALRKMIFFIAQLQMKVNQNDYRKGYVFITLHFLIRPIFRVREHVFS